jgi:RHS repeat-associated protein
MVVAALLTATLAAAFGVGLAAGAAPVRGPALPKPSSGQGPTFRVDSRVDATDLNPGDGTCADAHGRCTLRAAVMESNAENGRPATIDIPGGTYTLTLGAQDLPGLPEATQGDLDITRPVTIRGAGMRRTIVRAGTSSGSPVDRVFETWAHGPVSISQVGIEDGRVGPGAAQGLGGLVRNDGAHLTLDHVQLAHGQASCGGGGLFSGGAGASVTMLDSIVSASSAGRGCSGGNGGGVLIAAGSVAIARSTISNNRAAGSGAGIDLAGRCAGRCRIQLVNDTIGANRAAKRGGGAAFASGRRAMLRNVTVSGNRAGAGAGIYVADRARVSVVNTLIAGNTRTNALASSDCLGRLTSLGHNLASDSTCRLIAPGDQQNLDPGLGALRSNGGPTPTQALTRTSPAVNAGSNRACPATDQRGILRRSRARRPENPVCDIGSFELASQGRSHPAVHSSSRPRPHRHGHSPVRPVVRGSAIHHRASRSARGSFTRGLTTPPAATGAASTAFTNPLSTLSGRQLSLATPVPSCPAGADQWVGTSGAWETGSNWSAGVPSGADYVCITAANAAVTINSSVSVSGLLLGGGDGLDLQTGGLTLTNAGAGQASALAGSLTTESGAGLTVASGATLQNLSGAALHNLGAVNVSGTFDQDAGSVPTGAGVNSVQLLDGSALMLTGSGPAAFQVSAVGTISPTVKVSGDLAAGQSLDVPGFSNCSTGGMTTLSAAASFTNAGSITSEAPAGCFGDKGAATITLPTGDTLTNAGSMTLNGGAVVTFAGGTLANQGTLDVGSDSTSVGQLTFPAGSSLLNAGQMNVLAGSTLSIAAGGPQPAAQLSNATGGTIDDQGAINVSGVFDQGAGSIASGAGENAVQLLDGSSLSLTGSGPGAFQVSAIGTIFPTVSVSGNLASGQSLDIPGFSNCSTGGMTTLSAAASFTNAGSITSEAPAGCFGDKGAATITLPSADTLTNTGTISFDSGAVVTFAGGTLANQGTLDVGSDSASVGQLTFPAGSSLLNAGKVNVLAGSTVNIAAASTGPSPQAAAQLSNATGGAIDDEGAVNIYGAFNQGAGSIKGADSVQLIDGSSLTLNGAGPGAFQVSAIGTVSPTVKVSGDLAAGQSLDVPGFSNCSTGGMTTVDAAASFTNAGSITSEAPLGCFSDRGAATINLPSGDTLTNTGQISLNNAVVTLAAGKLSNQGAVGVGSGSSDSSTLTFAAGSLLTNTGRLTVVPGSTLAVAGAGSGGAPSAAKLSNGPGGTIDNQGAINVSGGFDQGAGSISADPGDNPVQLLDGSSLVLSGSGAGAFQVNATGTVSPTVSLSGSLAAGQSLDVPGFSNCSTGGMTTLDAAASFTNAGSITTEAPIGCFNDQGAATINLPSGGTLTNTGRISLGNAANGGVLTLAAGTLANQGTVDVGSGSNVGQLTLAAGSALVNAGAVKVASGSTLTVAGAAKGGSPAAAKLSNASGGTIDNQGAINTYGAFDQGAGSITGANPVQMVDGSSLTISGSGPGAFQVSAIGTISPTVTVSGDLASGQSLDVPGFSSCATGGMTTISVSGNFTNSGTITSEAPVGCFNDQGAATISLPSAGTLTNRGTISLTNGAVLHLSGKISQDAGLFDIASGSQFVSGTGFTANGGAIEGDGSFISSSGTFTEVGARTPNGPIHITGGALAFAGTGQADFLIPAGADPSISGDIAADQSLTIDDTNGVCGGTVVTAKGAFTNAGTIKFTGNVCPSAPAELITGTGLITNTGTIAFDATSGGAGEIDGPIANQDSGTISVDGGGAGTVSGSVSNSGTVSVNSGTLSLSGGLSNLDPTTGALTGGSYQVLGSASDPATLDIKGANISTLNASLEVGPGASFADSLPQITKIASKGSLVLDSGTSAAVTGGSLENAGNLELGGGVDLSLSGYGQDSSGLLQVDVAGHPGTSGASGALTASGHVNLSGGLAIADAKGFIPSSGDKYTPISGQGVTGTFSHVTGTAAGGGLAYVVNYSATAVDLDVQPGVDLATSAVSGPSTATVGQPAKVGWTVTAKGRSVSGSWTDAVYLSPTGTVGPDSVLVGTTIHSGGLAANSSYNGSLSASIPGVMPGSWRFVVVADAGGSTGDLDTTNNSAASAPLTVGATILGVAGKVSGTIPANGDSYVEITPNAGSNLQLTATFPAPATASLYEALGRIPSPGDHDGAASDTSAATQSLTVADTQAGTYFIDLNNPTSSPQAYTLSAGAATVAITSVTPQTANFVYDAVICSTGTCPRPSPQQAELSVTIDGAGFTPASTATLDCTGLDATTAGQTTRTFPTKSLTFAGSTELYADFGQVPSPTGACAVNVSSGTASAQLAHAITFGKTTLSTFLSSAPPSTPHVSVVAPSVNRPNVDSFVVVNYSNPYSYPIPAPLMNLVANGAKLHYPNQPAGDTSVLPVLGASPKGDPGVLAPGAAGSVEVAFDSTVEAHQTVSFSVDTIDSPSAPEDLGAMLAAGLPAGTAPGVVAYVKAQAPSVDAGGLQALLDADASHLASIGEPDSNAEDLLAYELNKLIGYGALLTDHTDGPFGYGLPGLVDSITVDPSGNVALRSPQGTSLVFPVLPGGGYGSMPGVLSSLAAAPAGGWELSNPDGSLEDFNAAGQLISQTDPHGNVTAYAYSGQSLTGISRPDGDQVTLQSDGNGHVTSIADSRTGQSATYGYDSSGRLISETVGGQSIKLGWNHSSSNEAVDGTLASVTAVDGVSDSLSYDSQGRLTGVTRSDGTPLSALSYPSPGTVAITDAVGNITTDYLDRNGRPARQTLPDGTAVAVPLNSAGEPTMFSVGGSSEQLAYDSSGNPSSITDPAGHRTALSFAAPGALASVTAPDGLLTSIQRNLQNDPTAITDPGGNASAASYTPAGLIASVTDRAGATTQFSYDGAHDPIAERLPGGGSVALSYDSRHNLISASDGSGTTSYTYDAENRLTGASYPNGLGVTIGYDAAGRRTSLTTSDGYALNYHYNGAGELSSLTDRTGATIVSYTYDAAGRPLKAVNGNGTSTEYQYDKRGQLASVVNKNASGSVSSSYTYTRNALGESTSVAGPSGTSAYTYDAAGNLTGATLPGGRKLTYSYDAAGNRTTTSDSSAGNAKYSLGPDDEYSSAGGTSYTFDKNGQLLSSTDAKGTTTYTWTPQGQLASADGPGGHVRYTYDALGNLVSKTVNGTTTDVLVDPMGGGLLGSYSASGGALAHYPAGVGAVGQTDPSGKTSYYGFDGSGNVVSITGPTGSTADSFTYLPFGQLAGRTGSDSTPFGFAGQFGVTTDPVTGFTVNGVRQYDPTTGRFISQDSTLLGGANSYEYAGNDPIDETDLTGHDALDDSLGWWNNAATAGQVGAGAVRAGNALAAQSAAAAFKNSTMLGDYLLNSAVEHASMASAAGKVANFANWAGGAVGMFQGGYEIGQTLYNDRGADGWTMASDLLAGGGRTVFNTGLGLILGGPITSGVIGAALPVAEDAITNALTDALVPAFQPGGIWGPKGGGDFGSAGGASSATRGSHDPNQIIGPSGYSTAGYLPGGASLPYEIDFVNDAKASLPAATVTVTEPLDPNVDLSTFSLGSFGFGKHIVTPPPGLRSYQATIDDTSVSGLDVRVDARLDSAKRLVTWRFTSIDPATGFPPADASAGFLAPDQKPPEGEGFVTYVVNPLAGATSGTRVSAHASIVFDANDPIATSTVSNTIDSIAPTASVRALPATETSPFTLSWGGSDGSGGSGIATYDVEVSDNGGTFRPLETNTTSTSMRFTGKLGHTYAFMAWATDHVNNVQAQPAAAQARTKIVAAPRRVPSVALTGSTARVSHSRAALVLSCAGAPCHGSVTLLGTQRRTIRRHGKRIHRVVTVSYGSASYTASPGRTTTVRITLNSAGRNALRHARGHRLAVRAKLVVAGGQSRTVPLTLTGA